MNKKAKLPELLTLIEACQILKVHPNTLRKLDKKDISKSIRFGERKDKRYKMSDVQLFIDKKTA